MGTKIKLSGWDKFRGGLDTRGAIFSVLLKCSLYLHDLGTDLTGTHSYYTTFGGNEIMFHVSLMMPIKDSDPSRKRYIGNDVVVIIFKEANTNDKFDAHVV